MEMRALLVALALAPCPLHARLYTEDVSDIQEKLRSGEWNERIRAVNRLGELGPDALPALREALEDPDWQVRLMAVHRLGVSAGEDGSSLRGMLERERCPLVRMSAVHWLGRIRLEAKTPVSPISGEEIGACESWFWPAAKHSPSARARDSTTAAYTPVDEQGCRYIRYERLGRALCPKGTAVRGVGPAPGAPKLLGGRAPRSGVVLCCPAAPEAARVEEPQEVECRLHPIECPAPWRELEPAQHLGGDRPWKYLRTQRMRENEIQWVHCCRPHGLDLERTAGESENPAEEPTDQAPAQEEAPSPGTAAAPAPQVAARQRLDELDTMLALKAENLPRPQAPPARASPEDSPDLALKLPERTPPEPGLDPRLRGAQTLPRPDGVSSRPGSAVSAPADPVADAGTRLSHDPLPELLEMIRHPDPARRSRAAEALGVLEPGGVPAVDALKKALKDPSPRVRASAALGLGNVTRGTDAAVKELKGALKDRSADVRYSAAEALGRIGTSRARGAFNGHVRGEARRLIGAD